MKEMIMEEFNKNVGRTFNYQLLDKIENIVDLMLVLQKENFDLKKLLDGLIQFKN